MEEDLDSSASGLVKHLDFADVTFTSLTITPPMGGISGNAESLDVSVPNNNLPSKGLEENPAIEELRQEAQRIRENLEGLDAVCTLPQSYKDQLSGAQVTDARVQELKKLFSFLKSEYQELAAKEGLLQLFAELSIGDEKNDEICLQDDVPEIQSLTDSLRTELKNLKQSNADTIEEIEALIHGVADDMSIFENNLSYATDCLEECDLEVDKLAEREKDKHDGAILMIKQSETPLDLEETIRLLEEQLRQNEKDYEETEEALKQRIEEYNLEMEELQAQARQLDKEEESLRMIVDVSGRCLRSQTLLESINDVAVIAAGDEFVELQLTTDVPTLDEPCEAASGRGVKQELKHKLYITVNSKTMGIETAELIPGDVPIDDLVDSTRQTGCGTSDESFESPKDGDNAEFGRQFAFLVKAVHHRISIYALKAASLSSASNDPRYCVEFLPDSSVITVTIPEKLKTLVEVPQGWPMHGFSLRLRSLHSEKEESAATADFLQEVMELANNMPEYARHDVLSFVEAVERLIADRNSQTHVLSW